MNPSDFSFRDLQVILDHFPDGVDVIMVDRPQIKEFVPSQNWTPWEEPESDPSSTADINEQIHQYNLNEIEPETGIYAAMSPVTRRVYVYVSPEYPQDTLRYG